MGDMGLFQFEVIRYSRYRDHNTNSYFFDATIVICQYSSVAFIARSFMFVFAFYLGRSQACRNHTDESWWTPKRPFTDDVSGWCFFEVTVCTTNIYLKLIIIPSYLNNILASNIRLYSLKLYWTCCTIFLGRLKSLTQTAHQVKIWWFSGAPGLYYDISCKVNIWHKIWGWTYRPTYCGIESKGQTQRQWGAKEKQKWEQIQQLTELQCQLVQLKKLQELHRLKSQPPAYKEVPFSGIHPDNMDTLPLESQLPTPYDAEVENVKAG